MASDMPPPVHVDGTVSFGLPRAVTREIDRRAAAELGLAGVVLMENAGRNVVDLLERLGVDGPVAIVCGKGNNGGDGFVIARHLALRGYDCRVLLCANEDELSGDAAANYRALRGSSVPVTRLLDRDWSPDQFDAFWRDCAWIVDALLGTGVTGVPREHLSRVIDAVNRSGRPVLAVDLPSGMDSDTGLVAGSAVRACHTATFVGPKAGFAHPDAAGHTGTVSLLPIGVPREWLEGVLATLMATR